MRALALLLATICSILCGVVIALCLGILFLEESVRHSLLCVMVVFFSIAYVVPGLIAVTHSLERAKLIFAINLLLGWTGFGWILACIMVLQAKSRNASPWKRQDNQGSKGCPVCGYTRKRCNSDTGPVINNRKAQAETEYRQSTERVNPISPPFRPRG